MLTPALDRFKQTAGRFVKVAGPPARTVRDRVVHEVGRRLGKGVQDVAPQRAPEEPAQTRPEPTPAPRAKTRTTSTTRATNRAPNPATIAKNVAHERPRAKPPAEAHRDPDTVPGGRLPPRRPRTT